MKTKEPVTLSGWYELEDGRVQHFAWENGRLIDGPIVADWWAVGQIKKLEEEEIDS